MAIFKRIEVWVLLALSLAAVWYVLKVDSGPGGINPPGRTPAISGDPGGSVVSDGDRLFQLQQIRVMPEDDHEIIEIEVRGKNQGDAPLDLSNGAARLVTRDGSEIPPFFVPFAAPPLLAAGEESVVTLRYWQGRQESENRSPLTLEIGEETLSLAWSGDRYESAK